MWAAQRMGLSGADAEAYAKEVVTAKFEPGGDKKRHREGRRRSCRQGSDRHAGQIRFELQHFAEQAKQRLMKE